MRQGARPAIPAQVHTEGVDARVGPSDAHFGDLAKVVILFRGRSATDLRWAIEDRSTVPGVGRVRQSRLGLRDYLQNQYRSLLRLPIIRAGAVWRPRQTE